ncbi:phosphotransferase family protein [Actinomadura madurae]|uniref:phosphotransferase family protein n=1 Tax=Actinomadura madurae TaxID=1993 RepID=UPI00399BFD59
MTASGPEDPALDRAAIRRWMDEQELGSGPLSTFEPLSGGTQNVMVAFERAGRRYVLRRGPKHLRPRSNRNISREITLLASLASTSVPHARLIAACEDPTVLHGAIFYLMEPVDGFNARVALPDRWEHDIAIRHRAGLALVEALATLGAVDHERVGLGGFGKPDNFLERQVDRWMGELDSYSTLPGYAGPEIDGLDRVAAWLTDNRPSSWSPGILHGDYHVANVMFRPDRGEVAAIVDWEMSTIGDPVLDLGQLIAVWPEGSGTDLIGSALARAGGLPAADELVVHYGERSARDLSAIDWYVVLGCFKLGIVLEGTYARAQAGKADPATGMALHATTLALFARARQRISGRSQA